MRIGRLTVSDRASGGVYEDRSGPEIEAALQAIFPRGVEFVRALVPDERPRIEEALTRLVDDEGCALVVTTGGTGPSPRDITPEATRTVIAKELPGFGEIMRAKSFETVPTAILSRATAGIRGTSLVLNLPGNPKAVRECLTILGPAILDALGHLRREA